jgi:hypothetical protein
MNTFQHLNTKPLAAMDIFRKPYVYKPLASSSAIRLLCLRPAIDFAAPLICDIKHDDREQMVHDIASNRQYETVSYTWGTSDLSHEIYCDHGASVIKVTPTVDSMLRYLRKANSVRYLWIDAVCLNQADDDEKSIQIRLMQRIYQRAMKTHVWLGSENDSVKHVFALLYRLARATSAEESSLHFDVRACESSIHIFFALAWFRRRWVLQEISFSYNVVLRCGKSKLPWKIMTRALTRLTSSTTLRNESIRQSAQAVLTAFPTNEGEEAELRGIFDVLWDCRHTECSDPRDRIFAVLGLCGDIAYDESEKKEARVHYLPHYQDGWVEVYRHFTESCITAGKFLLIKRHLFAFGDPLHRNADLPSWVPDWSSPVFEEPKDPIALFTRTHEYFWPETIS